MENYQIGLLTTFVLGLFILLGAIISLTIRKRDKIIDFSIGLACGVIVTLIITDLIPEIIEGLGLKNIYLFIIFVIIGFFLLKILDNFIPDHHDNKMTKKEAEENLIHIGIITSITLVLHNIIEGMAVYTSCLSDASLGVALTIGVGFHNIPLGMVIASSFYSNNKDISKRVISIGVVSISTFIGGFIMYLFDIVALNEIILGILLSITMGMLLFIVIDELLPRIRNTKEKKTSYSGILVGVILLFISSLII